MWRNTVSKRDWYAEIDERDHVLLRPTANSTRVISSIEFKKNGDSASITVNAGSNEIKKMHGTFKGSQIRVINPLKSVLEININVADLASVLTKISNLETNKELAMPKDQIDQYAGKFNARGPKP